METFESEEKAIRRRVTYTRGWVSPLDSVDRLVRDRELLLAEVDRLQDELDRSEQEVERLEEVLATKGEDGFWT